MGGERLVLDRPALLKDDRTSDRVVVPLAIHPVNAIEDPLDVLDLLPLADHSLLRLWPMNRPRTVSRVASTYNRVIRLAQTLNLNSTTSPSAIT